MVKACQVDIAKLVLKSYGQSLDLDNTSERIMLSPYPFPFFFLSMVL